MSKSHPIIIFFLGYILFVRLQCRGTREILNESKLSEHKELCFKRCDFGFQADDKGTSSKEMFGRRSCYEKCLREDGESKSVERKRRAFVAGQETSLLKRIRRGASNMTGKPNSCFKSDEDEQNCFHGSAVNNTPFEAAEGRSMVFHELENKGRYSGTIAWKPIQSISDDWAGYKILINYEGPDHRDTIECWCVPKVVTFPHSGDLYGELSWYQTHCQVPSTECGVELKKHASTSPPTVDASTSPPTVAVTTHVEPDNHTVPVIAAIFAALCAVALFLAYVYYCRRKKYKPIRLVNPLTGLKFEFDAFIIYSSHDSEWVVKTLLPTLEEKHRLKCCVHYRDFTLGIPIRQNMVDSVYKCKKTVAVVSKNFFNSNYCGSELDYALHRLMEKNDDSLVVIKLDDVDRNKLPKELQNRSYIDYPKSIEKETWEKKLIKCLKVTS